MKIMGRCQTCIHWHEEKQHVGGVVAIKGDRAKVGVCKRYPPQIVPEMRGFMNPRTAATDVCGEYSAEVTLNGN